MEPFAEFDQKTKQLSNISDLELQIGITMFPTCFCFFVSLKIQLDMDFYGHTSPLKGSHMPDLERLDFSSIRLLAPVERKIS